MGDEKTDSVSAPEPNTIATHYSVMTHTGSELGKETRKI